jgi:hypothetical protein
MACRITTRTTRFTASAALLAAAATLVAGCGGQSQAEKLKKAGCVWEAQGRARIETVIDMYRKGELGSPADLRRKVGRPAPFIDANGDAIPLGRLSSAQRVAAGKYVLDLAGADDGIRAAENAAVSAAREAAEKSC